MTTVAFVAPYSLETTMRFVQAVAELPGVRFALVTHEAEERVPEAIRARLAQHWRVTNCLDPDQLAAAVEGIGRRIGRVEQLIGTLEELQVPLAQVRARFGIPGLGVEAARNFRDKTRMKSVLQAAGLPCARHREVESAEAAVAFARDAGFPLVAKPPAGAGARNTFRIEDAAQLRQWLDSSPPTPGAPVLLEEFITGAEHSFDSVMVGGRLVWHSISRYFPTPLDVLSNPWIQWCVMLPREIHHAAYDDIRAAAEASLRVLGMETGLTHMEWFRRPDARHGSSLAISEVAARPPGAQFTTLLSYAHDLDLYKAWARLAVTGAFEAPERRWAVGAAYLRGQGHGKVVAVHGLDVVAEELGPLIVESRLPRKGQQPTGSYEGEGYVILRHRDTEVVERALARLVSVVRVELA